jgi:hypothetical protein
MHRDAGVSRREDVMATATDPVCGMRIPTTWRRLPSTKEGRTSWEGLAMFGGHGGHGSQPSYVPTRIEFEYLLHRRKLLNGDERVGGADVLQRSLRDLGAVGTPYPKPVGAQGEDLPP